MTNITLEDLDNYCKAYREGQIAAPDAPQPVIRPSVLENFVEWMKQEP